MGNSLGAKKKSATIMKITGEAMKIKTPATALDVTKDHPGLVLLDSEMVKHYGVRAKPLEPQEELKAKRLYFLVELPKLPEDKGPRRVQSGINMSAKDRLESLMLARRSASDLSYMKAPSIAAINGDSEFSGILRDGPGAGSDSFRVKLRLPKAEVERLMKESKDRSDAAEKIMKLCMEKDGGAGGGGGATTEGRRRQGRGVRFFLYLSGCFCL
ncbi:hypothetical protein HanHA300_Chr12g0437651 [Helianthus annuus]|nr:hypothetical protein HanHA300_Chr12g0437651 [Helianthus annuus]KAJ0504707.1 hypothetical protein HanHA89_Chr12g0462311 [Helianthus annuus]KAJ0674439.1 hypothetical protein HanLR1_Chr12g0439991 [Helianthus annuus]